MSAPPKIRKTRNNYPGRNELIMVNALFLMDIFFILNCLLATLHRLVEIFFKWYYVPTDPLEFQEKNSSKILDKIFK